MKITSLLVILACCTGFYLGVQTLESDFSSEPVETTQEVAEPSEVAPKIAKNALTLKPGGRDTGKMLQKHFRSHQQEIYTQFLQELTADSFAFGPYRTLTTENRKLKVTSYVYSDGRILSVFRPRGRAGKRLQLVHFAQIIDGVGGRVANRGFVVFDYREEAYYFAKGARSFSQDLRVTLHGSFKRRKTLLIPAADLHRNYTWLTFAPPKGGIRKVEYDFAD